VVAAAAEAVASAIAIAAKNLIRELYPPLRRRAAQRRPSVPPSVVDRPYGVTLKKDVPQFARSVRVPPQV
jgi:hypothetical protein